MKSKIITKQPEPDKQFTYPGMRRSKRTGNIFLFPDRETCILLHAGPNTLTRIGQQGSTFGMPDAADSSYWENLRDDETVELRN